MTVSAFADYVGLSEPDTRHLIGLKVLPTKTVPTKASADATRIKPEEREPLLAKLIPLHVAAARMSAPSGEANGPSSSAAHQTSALSHDVLRTALGNAGIRTYMLRQHAVTTTSAPSSGPAAMPSPGVSTSVECVLEVNLAAFIAQTSTENFMPVEDVAAAVGLSVEDAVYLINGGFLTSSLASRGVTLKPTQTQELPRAAASAVIDAIESSIMSLQSMAAEKFGGGDLDTAALVEPYQSAGFRILYRAHEADPTLQSPWVIRREADTWFEVTYA
jgi:hypothetical protein